MPPESDTHAPKQQLAKKADDTPRFDLATLRSPRGAAMIGRGHPDIVGAFHGEPDETEATIEAAQRRVDEWLQSPMEADR